MQHTRSDGALTLSQPFLTAADGGCVCSVTISRLYLEDHTVVLLLEGFFSTSAGTSQLATFSAPPMESSASHRRAGLWRRHSMRSTVIASPLAASADTTRIIIG